ncbi:glycosyltransferase family 2 protein [Roseinatronobacter bogoriensis subsp. barguzinensis]|uniref:Glycosyltransferase family 2 protein n=2 Tax=Roseinatronobacter bogoriensis TaxID=119542 RepID=A0A2K8KHP8_9RHOB|nr:glycosyltransferase family 2 protein [Rhodobaca barguzinensis]
MKDAAGTEHRVFVDAVARADGKLVVLGWSSSAIVNIDLLQGTTKLPAKLSRHARGDVAEALKLTSGDTLGFCVLADIPVSKAALEVSVGLPNAKPYQSGALGEVTGLTNLQRTLIPELLESKIADLKAHEVGSVEWREALAKLPEAQKAPAGFHGFVEGIFVSPEGNGVVFGWALHPEGAPVWLEDELLNIYPIEVSFRRERRDIAEAFKSILWSDMEAAFITHLPTSSKNPTIKLRAATSSGVVTLSERSGAEMLPSDPRGVAEKLFAIETEDRNFQRRANIIDWPILQPVIKRYREELATIVPRVAKFGAPPETPAVSVIIPLYKRFDFMEHQMLEFCRDPFLRSNAEVIYVIDDPEIRTAVLNEADHLFRLYGLPFKVISGLRNRGFSGANNLGADHANGAHLLFMNSDVIPISPGWLEKMLEAVEDDNVGAVGAQLLFPDGGIQHIRMDFEYLDYFNIWSNNHPGSGMPPLAATAPPFEVPAVTGACILIPRPVFDQIEAWDTGYLLGDFEDSHICFAIRAAGYRVMCQPASTLTHLERQSFTGIGGDAFRMRMTICNAVRHYNIWKEFLEPHSDPDVADTDLQQDTDA